MRYTTLLLAFFALSGSLLGDATAYQALTFLSERKGTRALQHLYLIRGAGGRSQPSAWTLYRGLPSDTSFHITEVRSSGEILEGRAPISEQGLPPDALPLDLSVLNLDTHAAWNIAKKHARRESFDFTCVDYQLNTHPLARVPAWTLHLFNERRGTLGTITLSGATGEVLNKLKLYRYRIESVTETKELILIRESWGNRAVRSVGRWFSRSGETAGHDLLNAAGTTEEILLNRRTRHFSEDAR